MKKIILVACAIVSILTFHSFILQEKVSSDILKQLGIPEEIAKENVWRSFSSGYFSYPYMPSLIQTAVSTRGGIVQQIGEFAKAFTKSEEFKKHYTEYREENKPKTTPEKPKSMAERKKQQREELQKNIKSAEEDFKKAPADQRKTLQESYKEIMEIWKEQLKALDDPNNPMFNKEAEEGTKLGYEMQLAEYQNALKEWEKKYPPTPNEMIKHWLQEFLTISKDVDFNAKLTKGENGNMVFVNPDYEAKSREWKLCFRVGKESVTAAQGFFQQWLNELK